MRKNSYLKKSVLLSLILLAGTLNNSVFGQCSCTANDYGAIDVAGWVPGQSGNITTCQWGGERSTITNTVNGAVYLISTCGAGYEIGRAHV